MNNKKNDRYHSLYYSEIEAELFDKYIENERLLAIEKIKLADRKQKETEILMNEQTKLAIIAIIIYLVISSLLNSPSEPEVTTTNHSKSRGEMLFDAEMETYGGYENYLKQELIKGCLDGCNPLEEECDYCMDIK